MKEYCEDYTTDIKLIFIRELINYNQLRCFFSRKLRDNMEEQHSNGEFLALSCSQFSLMDRFLDIKISNSSRKEMKNIIWAPLSLNIRNPHT